mgnify:CR=1 FL=1
MRPNRAGRRHTQAPAEAAQPPWSAAPRVLPPTWPSAARPKALVIGCAAALLPAAKCTHMQQVCCQQGCMCVGGRRLAAAGGVAPEEVQDGVAASRTMLHTLVPPFLPTLEARTWSFNFQQAAACMLARQEAKWAGGLRGTGGGRAALQCRLSCYFCAGQPVAPPKRCFHFPPHKKESCLFVACSAACPA